MSSMKVIAIKCEHCGKKFVPHNANQHFCCKNCCYLHSKRRKTVSKPAKTLEQWQTEARACGLTYGQYRAQIEHFGKSFEELKLWD